MREKQRRPQQQKRRREDDLIFIDLPAPSGWSKKFFPKQSGFPRRDEIVFISPTGEQIRSKSRLQQYLKSHPGGPAVSEFDWGTGDSPRRSARLSQKSKATKLLESVASKKKQKKSNDDKEPEEESDSDREGEAAEDGDNTTEATEITEVSAKGAEASGVQETVKAIDESPPAIDALEDSNQKTDDEVSATEKPLMEDGCVVLDNKDAKVGEPLLEELEYQEDERKIEKLFESSPKVQES